MHSLENSLNSIRNSQLERYFYRPEYLKIISVLETAAIVVSVVGWPLIPIAFLPIAYDLTNNTSLRRIYTLWRSAIVLGVGLLFCYKVSYLDVVTTLSSTVRTDEEILLTLFRPQWRSLYDLMAYLLLCVLEMWILLLTMMLPMIVNTQKNQPTQNNRAKDSQKQYN